MVSFPGKDQPEGACVTQPEHLLQWPTSPLSQTAQAGCKHGQGSQACLTEPESPQCGLAPDSQPVPDTGKGKVSLHQLHWLFTKKQNGKQSNPGNIR